MELFQCRDVEVHDVYHLIFSQLMCTYAVWLPSTVVYDGVFSVSEFPNEQQVSVVFVCARLPMLVKRHTVVVRVCRMSHNLNITECDFDVFVSVEIGSKALHVLRLVLYLVCDLFFPRSEVAAVVALHWHSTSDDDSVITEHSFYRVEVFLVVEATIVLDEA